jgi:hypothetical protein
MIASPNPSAFGQSVTFTVTVTATLTGLPIATAGTVTFKDGVTTIGSSSANILGQATFTTSTLGGGSHTITAVYAGNAVYNPSTSASLTQNVTPNASTTALISSVNPSALSQSVTFTATVSGIGGTPGGSVTFKDGATTLGTSTLDGGGQATLTTSALAAGSHAIVATYNGSANFNASTSSQLSQIVNLGSSNTLLIASPNPSSFGQAVTFTASVSGSSGTPTGTVTFKDGATTLGTVTLDGAGQATLTTSALATGSHSVTAAYGGDTTYNASGSTPLTQTVNQAASATALISSVNPSALTQSVTFTATVSSPGGTPSGTVTFKDGAVTLGSGTLDGSGNATFTTALLLPGSHSITAAYGGATNYSASASAPLSQNVTLGASSTSVISSVNPSAAGQSVTFTATVSGLIVVPTGTVTFKDGATTLGSGTLNGAGQATFSTASLTAGGHAITAVYGGDAIYNASTSAPLTQTVGAGSSTTTLTSSANPAVAGQPVAFTATVSGSGATPTGTVTFKDGTTTLATATLDGGAQATFSSAAFSAGTHAITASYGGDGNFSASTSPALSQAINTSAVTITLSSSANPSAPGQIVSLTAVLTGNGATPTGAITFKDGGAVLGATTLVGGRATLSTATLSTGSHVITAVYGGDARFAAQTSSPLHQNVNVPADSTRLRTVQSAVARLEAQGSAIVITGAVENAISDAFSGGGQLLTPNAMGLRASFAAEPKTTGSIGPFAVAGANPVQPNLDAPTRRWLPWVDLRATGWSASRSAFDMRGGQVNVLGGLTHLVTPDFLVGVFGGYEAFDYRTGADPARVTGDGATLGGYAAWRLRPDLRIETGIAHTWLSYRAAAGTATATISGERWLLNVGVTGKDKLPGGLTIEPSARVYVLREQDRDYLDSLGTSQPRQNFSAGRTSLGAKLSAPYRMSDALTLTPYAGAYADYAFTNDGSAAAVLPNVIRGWSARLTSGLSATTNSGLRASIGAELGGLGSPVTTWSLRGSVAIPF